MYVDRKFKTSSKLMPLDCKLAGRLFFDDGRKVLLAIRKGQYVYVFGGVWVLADPKLVEKALASRTPPAPRPALPKPKTEIVSLMSELATVRVKLDAIKKKCNLLKGRKRNVC
jgi:hypothetical protein